MKDEEEFTKEELEQMMAALKKENAETRELLERREKLLSAEQLAGIANAGETKVEKKVETPQEYAKRVMGGTI